MADAALIVRQVFLVSAPIGSNILAAARAARDAAQDIANGMPAQITAELEEQVPPAVAAEVTTQVAPLVADALASQIAAAASAIATAADRAQTGLDRLAAQSSANAAAASVPAAADRTLGLRLSSSSIWTMIRSTRDVVVGPDGALADVAVDTAGWAFEPSTLAPLGVQFQRAGANAVANPSMEGLVAGSPGTMPTGWAFGTQQAGVVRTVSTNAVGGITVLTFGLTGTASNSQATSIETSARGSGPAATPGQARVISAWVRIRSGSLTGVATLGLRGLSCTASGASTGGGVNSILSSVDGTWRRYRFAITTSSDVTTARCVMGIVLGVTNGAAVNIEIDIGLPTDEPDAVFASAPMRPVAGATGAAVRTQGTVTIPVQQLGTRLSRRKGMILLDWCSQPGPFSSANDADWMGLISLGDQTSSNNLCVVLNPAHTRIEARLTVGGVAQTPSVVTIPALAASTIIRTVLSWDLDGGFLQISANGVQGSKVALTSMPPALTHVMPGRNATLHAFSGQISGIEARPGPLFDAAQLALAA